MPPELEEDDHAVEEEEYTEADTYTEEEEEETQNDSATNIAD